MRDQAEPVRGLALRRDALGEPVDRHERVRPPVAGTEHVPGTQNRRGNAGGARRATSPSLAHGDVGVHHRRGMRDAHVDDVRHAGGGSGVGCGANRRQDRRRETAAPSPGSAAACRPDARACRPATVRRSRSLAESASPRAMADASRHFRFRSGPRRTRAPDARATPPAPPADGRGNRWRRSRARSETTRQGIIRET